MALTRHGGGGQTNIQVARSSVTQSDQPFTLRKEIDGLVYKTVETRQEVEKCFDLYQNSFLKGITSYRENMFMIVYCVYYYELIFK